MRVSSRPVRADTKPHEAAAIVPASECLSCPLYATSGVCDLMRFAYKARVLGTAFKSALVRLAAAYQRGAKHPASA